MVGERWDELIFPALGLVRDESAHHFLDVHELVLGPETVGSWVVEA